MPEYIFDVAPNTKPRMTQRDQWRKRPCVMKYRAFCDELRLKANLKKFDLPAAGMDIHFGVPMPKSWTKKKKAEMNGEPHQQKPDVDNFLKALFDALTDEDEYVWSLDGVKKTWTETGKGFIKVTVN